MVAQIQHEQVFLSKKEKTYGDKLVIGIKFQLQSVQFVHSTVQHSQKGGDLLLRLHDKMHITLKMKAQD